MIHLQVFPTPGLCKYSSLFYYIVLPNPSKILFWYAVLAKDLTGFFFHMEPWLSQAY